MSDVTPFRGHRSTHVPVPTRVLCRFTKAGHVAEIRERVVSTVRALEYLVFIDDDLSESQMFHGPRSSEYLRELVARMAQFTDNGWLEDLDARSVSQFGLVH